METGYRDFQQERGNCIKCCHRPQELRTKTFPLASRQEGCVTCLRTLLEGGKLSPYSRVSGGVNWRYGMGAAGSPSSSKMSDREAEEKEEGWWPQEGTEGA